MNIQRYFFLLLSFCFFSVVSAAPPVIVTGISPSNGPTTGGTPVTISGSGFSTVQVFRVNFDITGAPTFIVVNDTTITSVTPSHAAGATRVTLSTSSGSSTGNVFFTFVAGPPPVVTEVSPNRGTVMGGNTVTITGQHLSGVTSVHFGSNAATSTHVISDTSITVTAPQGSAGTVDVTVTTPDGTSATNPDDEYTYVSSPIVLEVDPNSGSTSGETTVTITGVGFTGATGVLFGLTSALSFTVESDTTIIAIAPSHSAARLMVTVLGALNEFNEYTYINTNPSGPARFSGKTVINYFLNRMDRIHILKWTPSTDLSVVSYSLYRNGKKIATIPASGPYKYEDHNSGKHDVYILVSVNGDGSESNPLYFRF